MKGIPATRGTPGFVEIVRKVTCRHCGRAEIYDAETMDEFKQVAVEDGWTKTKDGWAHEECVRHTLQEGGAS